MFKHGKIYLIQNDVDKMIYIGSTCKSVLTDRMWKHSSDSMKPEASNYNCKLYQHIRALGQFSFDIVLVETYPCETEYELRVREQHWMDHYSEKGVVLLNQRRAVSKKRMPKDT